MSEERVWKTLRERVKSSRHSLSISDKVGILNEYRDFVAGKEVRKGIKREFLRYLTLRLRHIVFFSCFFPHLF